MIYLEACQFAILTVLFLHTSSSDLKSGKIHNKSILIALVAGLPCAGFYYILFATDCLLAYSINVGLVTLISLILYSSGIWGAGDSKLLVTTILLFPARIYCIGNRSMASCFLLISFIFISSFVYVLFDTLYQGITQKDLFVLPKRNINWKSYAKSFLFFFLLLSISNAIIYSILPKEIVLDRLLLSSIHFVLILIGMRTESKANWYTILAMGSLCFIFIIAGLSRVSLPGSNWFAYFVVVILMFFRIATDKYNYKTINVTELKPGMILSVGSILLFTRSKIAGLPIYTSEDLRSRLSIEEIESINCWAKTKNGKETITIVRKIPFALFIAIGTVLFTVLEVMEA